MGWVHMGRESWGRTLSMSKAMYKTFQTPSIEHKKTNKNYKGLSHKWFSSMTPDKYITILPCEQISRYFSNLQFYFQVNDQYVRNKLKVLLFSFLHRGHWRRITEPVGGKFSYKPPIYDINAPDLCTPFMAFGMYLVLAGFSLGLLGKFSPESLSLQFTRGLAGWFLQVALLKVLSYSVGGAEASLLDIVAYAGYAFTGLSVAILARVICSYTYYFLMPFLSMCMGVFFVKTMKRFLFAEVRSYERNSSRHHYFLLFMTLMQFPLFFWLGNVTQ